MKRTLSLSLALAALLAVSAYADVIGLGEAIARSWVLPAVLVIFAAAVTALVLRRRK